MKKLLTICVLVMMTIGAGAQPGGFGGPRGGFGGPGGPMMGGAGDSRRAAVRNIAPDFRMDPEGYASFAVEVLKSSCELTGEQAEKIEKLYLKEYDTIRKKLFGIDSPYATGGMGPGMMGMPMGMAPRENGGPAPEGARPEGRRENRAQMSPAEIARQAAALSELLDRYDADKAAAKLEKQVKKILTPVQRESYDKVRDSYEKRFSFDKFPGLTPFGSMLRPQSWRKPETGE